MSPSNPSSVRTASDDSGLSSCIKAPREKNYVPGKEWAGTPGLTYKCLERICLRTKKGRGELAGSTDAYLGISKRGGG